VTNIAKEVLEKRLGYQVELVMTDIGLQYAGVARGNLDVMLMAWLPTTHKAYWDKVSGDVVDLAVLYQNAKLGWAVPNYVPESAVSSISDLNKPEVRQKLHGQIQGIDPGAGLMRASERALGDYSLNGYTLQSASDAGMIVALDRAIKRNDWIVVTAWSPTGCSRATRCAILRIRRVPWAGPNRSTRWPARVSRRIFPRPQRS